MATQLSDRYPLTRGRLQLARVNTLQMLWRDTNKFLIHPSIEGQENSLNIADVATATGLWLCDIANTDTIQHKLYGFDISASSFIRSQDLPSNIHLETMDAAEDPPREWLGKFDLVHIRLLQSVIKDNDTKWVISHCSKLLRPGGYLQWEEFDPLAARVHFKDSIGENLAKTLHMLQTQVPAAWVQNLPKTMEEFGLGLVATERKTMPAFHNLTLTGLHCQVLEEYALANLDVNGPPGAGDAARALAQASFAEALQGAYVTYMFQTVVAMKKI